MLITLLLLYCLLSYHRHHVACPMVVAIPMNHGWAPSMHVSFMLDDRQLPNQCWVERHWIQLSGDKFDEVSLICGSCPSAKGPQWTLGLGGSMDRSAYAMWQRNLRRAVRMMCVSGCWSVCLWTFSFAMRTLQKIHSVRCRHHWSNLSIFLDSCWMGDHVS